MSNPILSQILTLAKESGFMLLSFAVGVLSFNFLNTFFRLIFFQVALAMLFYVGAYLVVQYQKVHEMTVSNHWMYNAYIFFEVIILLTAAYGVLRRQSRKYLVVAAGLIFAIVFFVEVALDGFWQILNITMVVAGLLLVPTFVFVLYEDISADEFSWKKSPVFWAVLGVVVYFACNVPFMGLFHILLEHNAEIVNYLFYITEILANLRYLMVSIAFTIILRHAWQNKFSL